MCAFSNLSTNKNTVKEGGYPANYRRPTVVEGLQSTKEIVEEYEISLDTDLGTNGRPRVKEEIKLPPQYENIDLNDPNDEVLFQGELVKYKAAINPSYMNRWVQVTEKSFRYFKGRCNAITCCNKPLTAIPILAIKKVEKVNFDLYFNKKEQEKSAPYNDNQFEIFLKDDFIDIYLRPEYEQRVACQHHGHGASDRSTSQSIMNSPYKVSQFTSSIMNVDNFKSSSPAKGKPGSPGKVRGLGGESHPMTAPEMKERFIHLEEGQRYSNLQDRITQSVNT
jgi:hypothetical protein